MHTHKFKGPSIYIMYAKRGVSDLGDVAYRVHIVRNWGLKN